ncbi:hypothetical protein ACTWP5_14550 [Streptomyces sp. 4N509B]|uniref:hypothetical protein n=1 Tax=Streptomyces sp. 4N509B TaxID=3457413 RepID=UPI003FD01379
MHFHTYIDRLSRLRPRPVDRRHILSDDLYVAPRFTPGEPPAARFDDSGSMSDAVLAVIGDEASGRRTTALKLLDAALGGDQPIFELFPDWEHPEVACIPDDPQVGYLLNLSGVREPLSSTFHEELALYGMKALAKGPKLIIVATEYVWQGAETENGAGSATVMRISRPSALQVARRRIAQHPELAARVGWLQDPSSVFANLLGGDEPPGEGVRLANIVLKAADANDAEARDSFLEWKHKLSEWFGADDPQATERRALQIAAAVLDGCPARVVLDAADLLLADEGLNWPGRPGGPLVRADDTRRCEEAGVDFADGIVSISRLRPDIDQALLKHVWRSRPQMVPILTRWLSTISTSQTTGDACVPRLATLLPELARSEGLETVLGLVHVWLRQGSARHETHAVDVLSTLALDPQLGAVVREKLLGWAKAPRKPERQRAVVALCEKGLGHSYPSIALTRLRYVLDNADDARIRDAAIGVIRSLLGDVELSVRVLNTILRWAAQSSRDVPSSEVFVNVFAGMEPTERGALVHRLLTMEGERGHAVRQLLGEGWRVAWRCPDLRPRAAEVLKKWGEAVSPEGLPVEAVVEVTASVLPEVNDVLGDEVYKLIGGRSPFHELMRARLVQVMAQMPPSRAIDDTDQVV